MNSLSKYLVESVLISEKDLFGWNKLVVVYSGRFQPFHNGHYTAYQKLVSKFGKLNVYIATSNKTDSEKSPFNFAEKKLIMTTLFNVPADKIINVKNPYTPVEILDKYEKTKTSYIAAVGEKDAARLGGKYFKKYKDGIVLNSYDENGYVYIIPMIQNDISGTRVRDVLSNGSYDEKKKMFLHLYPKYDEKIFNLIVNRLSSFKKESIREAVVKKIPHSLGIPRSQMPQIQSADVPNFIDFLKTNGVNVKAVSIPVKNVKMTQADINIDKVKQLMGTQKENLAKPVIVSSDNYILDGHHRVAALYNLDSSYKLKAIKTSITIQQLLSICKRYPKVFYKKISEELNSVGSLKELVVDSHTIKDDRELLQCGGAYGHMSHPFDIEMNLTFGDLKKIVKQALSGKLELAREKCIAGDSIIITENNGDMTISQFVDSKIEDRILSFNEETGKNEFMNVMASFNNDSTDEWLEIELEDGKTILVTPNHRMYVEGMGYVEAKNLTEDMELKILNPPSVFSQV